MDLRLSAELLLLGHVCACPLLPGPLSLVTLEHSEPSSDGNLIAAALCVEPKLHPPGSVADPWCAFSSSTLALSPLPARGVSFT